MVEDSALFRWIDRGLPKSDLRSERWSLFFLVLNHSKSFSMDPLSVVGAFIAVLQVSGTIVSHCYEYRKSVKSAPRDLVRILDEVSDLRNVIERLIRLMDEDSASGRRCLPAVEQMTLEKGPLARCQSELDILESKLEMPLGRWKALRKQLIWPLEEKEVLKSLETIRKMKSMIDSALMIDNTFVTIER